MQHSTLSPYRLLCSLVLVLLALSGGVAAAQEAPVLRIGVVDQVRGPVANGARLAIQQINDAGGVADFAGTLFQLELEVQPLTIGQPDDTAITALREAGLIAIIGPADDQLAAETLPDLQQLGIPVLLPATGDTLIAANTTGNVFRVRAAEVWQGRALADFLINGFGLTRIATVRLDLDSLPGLVGFSSAAVALGVEPSPALVLETDTGVFELLEQLLLASPEALVAYGPPSAVAELYTVLRGSGWQGLFAYPDADHRLFINSIPFDLAPGVLAATTWPFSALDPASVSFLSDYVVAYGEVPDEAAAAAGYDAVNLIAAALAQPGDLTANIARLDNVRGVQGLLRPAAFERGDTISDVSVVQLGQFGAPVVLTRYRDGERLPPDTPAEPEPPEIAPTATPEGVIVTVTSQRQNVRSGPGLVYPILGELLQGQQARVIATLPDRTWVVIDFAGMQGWMATYLLDVSGDLGTLPVVAPPPTPTPNVTPTPVLPQEADIVIDAVSINPQPAQPGPFTAIVTVRNAGNAPAGTFAIGATFPPNNIFASAVVGGLAPGQAVAVSLQASALNTGFYTASVVADINNQVPEGVVGESNNFFPVSYVIDMPLRSQGSQLLHLGDTIDLEDDAIQGDANWNADGGVSLDAIFGARLGILPGSDLNLIHWEVINPAIVNRDRITRGELVPGMLIGVITADGNRAVMRVEAVTDTELTVSYKTYIR